MTVDPSTLALLLCAAGAVACSQVPVPGRASEPLEPDHRPADPEPVVLYPVRHADEGTMRADLAAVGGRVVAISDHDDEETLAGLQRLRTELPNLDVVVTPANDDPCWTVAWRAWLQRTGPWREPRPRRLLPPRRRRMVVYGYHLVEAGGGAVVSGVHPGRG